MIQKRGDLGRVRRALRHPAFETYTHSTYSDDLATQNNQTKTENAPTTGRKVALTDARSHMSSITTITTAGNEGLGWSTGPNQ